MTDEYWLTGELDGFVSCNGVIISEQITTADNTDLLDENKPATLATFVGDSCQKSKKASSTSLEIDKGNTISL